MRTDGEARFLARGVLGGFAESGRLLTLFRNRAKERMQRILKHRPDSRWTPFEPQRSSVETDDGIVDYFKREWDLYVAASVRGKIFGRRFTVTIGIWHVADLAEDGKAILYLNVDSYPGGRRPLSLPEPRNKRVGVHEYVYLYIVPGKSVNLDREFGVLIDELRGMLPRLVKKRR